MIRSLITLLRSMFPGSHRPRSRRRRRIAVLLGTILCTFPLIAQTTGSPLQDSSFLIEPFSQETGAVQHVQTFARSTRGGDSGYTFTDQWPVTGISHQLSYALPLSLTDGQHGAGHIAMPGDAFPIITHGGRKPVFLDLSFEHAFGGQS